MSTGKTQKLVRKSKCAATHIMSLLWSLLKEAQQQEEEAVKRRSEDETPFLENVEVRKEEEI